jgi:hypothetical protein
VTRTRPTAATLVLIAAATVLWSDPDPAGRTRRRPRPAASPSAAPAVPATDEQLYAQAAASAWRFVDANYEPATGFVSATAGYPYATVWDLGSALAAYYSARELNLIDEAVYQQRTRTMLDSLRRMPLFDDVAFNKVYGTRSLAMARGVHTSRVGGGWSATDIGRLLVWLKIVGSHRPEFAEPAAAVVKRLKPEKLVREGYLQGATRRATGKTDEYQEGRIGYEQYAAAGFALWDIRAENALDLRRHGVPIEVMGRQLLADLRGDDRMTSEPFVLIGLEVGWSPALRTLATELLAAQEERWRRSGKVTMVSEDAIARAPHYFYYYCAYSQGKEFSTDVQNPRAVVDGPRWISAKAAYAWHALLPGEYTRRAVGAVARARGAEGWGSGVYEGEGRSTGTANVNTQAVILTAAVVRQRGRPLLEAAESTLPRRASR